MYEEISIDSRTGQKRMVIIPQTGHRRFRCRSNLWLELIPNGYAGVSGQDFGRSRRD